MFMKHEYPWWHGILDSKIDRHICFDNLNSRIPLVFHRQVKKSSKRTYSGVITCDYF